MLRFHSKGLLNMDFSVMNRSFQLYTQKPLTTRIMRFFPVVIILLSKVSEYAREPNKTKGSRNPVYYSHSPNHKQLCLIILARHICGSSDNKWYPYYTDYTLTCYHFAFTFDNSRFAMDCLKIRLKSSHEQWDDFLFFEWYGFFNLPVSIFCGSDTFNSALFFQHYQMDPMVIFMPFIISASGVTVFPSHWAR